MEQNQTAGADAEPDAGMSAPVELRIPTSSAYLALVRATSNAVCARADLPLDRLEDVTLAVDEAASLLIGDAVAGTPLVCRWSTDADGVCIRLSSVSGSGRPPRTTTFAWTVLTALVDRAEAGIADGVVTITLTAGRNWPEDDPVS